MIVGVTRHLEYGAEMSDTFYVDITKLVGDLQPLRDAIGRAIISEHKSCSGTINEHEVLNTLIHKSNACVDLPQMVEDHVDIFFPI